MPEEDMGRTSGEFLFSLLETWDSLCAEDSLVLSSGLKARFPFLNGWGGIRDDAEEVRERRALPLPFDKLGPSTFCTVEAPELDGLGPLLF